MHAKASLCRPEHGVMFCLNFTRKDTSVVGEDLDGDVDIPVVAARTDAYAVDLASTVYISGPHHIISNCQNDLPDALIWWNWMLVRLTNICRLLTRKYYKARLIVTCFSSPDTAAFATDIERFSAQPHAQRWGTTASAATQLVEIFRSLRIGWNKSAFLHRGQVENRDAEHSCNSILLMESYHSE